MTAQVKMDARGKVGVSRSFMTGVDDPSSNGEVSDIDRVFSSELSMS